MQEKYHHGNLRNSLIEAGIKLIHDEGMQSLSIRKVAAACGVSHAAPRYHFQDKESLLEAIREHITEKFTDELNFVVEHNQGNPEVLQELGASYLRFFLDNPYFYNLVFNHMGLTIDLKDPDAVNYPPFDVFKNCAAAVFEQINVPGEKCMQNVSAMWAMVHGITSLAVLETADNQTDWHGLLGNIMSENFTFAV